MTSRLAKPGGMLTSSFSDVADLTGVEPLQYQLEGPCSDTGASGERMLQGADGEQHKPYNRRQRQYHQPVRPRVLQAEEVGKAHCRYPTEDQNGPEDSGDALLGGDQAHPPGVGQSLDLVQSFRVELLVGLGMWLDLLQGLPDVVDNGPPGRGSLPVHHQGRFSLLHQGILLMDDLLGVGLG